MKNTFRQVELKVLVSRFFLAYIFYFIARLLFVLYNNDLLQVEDITTFFKICIYGLAFDTSAIIYLNLLFLLVSILPFFINTKPKFQKVLFYIYFVPNLIGYATNFVDFAFFRFNMGRSTLAVKEVLENEQNKIKLLFHFLGTYWHVFLLFIILSSAWVFLYKRIKLNEAAVIKKPSYLIASLVFILVIPALSIGGIRGDFKYSTRPITLVDASRHVKNPMHSEAVLNTPFAIIRTVNKHTFKKANFVSDAMLLEKINPIKKYPRDSLTMDKPNVVILILESYGREYIGAFNEHLKIDNYKSYTPFLDSLAKKSLIFPNSFANGRKSIHGMSSIFGGIPSFEVAFTSSSYVNQKIMSVVSGLNEMGYDTSFFHGAPNGSMGFLGFSTILGFDHYYGKTEYNYDADFDGIWGIWDEPFLQYMKRTLDKKKTPFMASAFTVTSHEPYIIPEAYKDVFEEGEVPMHKCVEYTDYALKRFFEEAKKESWFKNTIFVLTADHTNQIHYDEYKKNINKYAVPIMIYTPNEDFVGVDYSLAQQIDIFPTVLDMAGYEKPFRSWGRSLLDTNSVTPFVMTHNGTLYNFMQGNYICIFDGEKAIGFYDIEDKNLTNNLIGNRTPEMESVETSCKAFIQDYMRRIIDRKMNDNTMLE
ncbi:MAG: sulfatase-like hydrolase/transferase [Cellulophaga sp.]